MFGIGPIELSILLAFGAIAVLMIIFLVRIWKYTGRNR